VGGAAGLALSRGAAAPSGPGHGRAARRG
jgi:hypothetical protein